MVLIEGIGHPTAREEDYDGYYLRESEMKEMTDTLYGTPALHEHDGIDLQTGNVDNKKQIGKIQSACIDKKRRLRLMIDVNDDTPEKCEIIEAVKRGEYGLSIGMESEHEPGTGRIIKKRIREITFTKKPDMDGTKLKSIEQDSPMLTYVMDLVLGGKKKEQKKQPVIDDKKSFKTDSYINENNMHIEHVPEDSLSSDLSMASPATSTPQTATSPTTPATTNNNNTVTSPPPSPAVPLNNQQNANTTTPPPPPPSEQQQQASSQTPSETQPPAETPDVLSVLENMRAKIEQLEEENKKLHKRKHEEIVTINAEKRGAYIKKHVPTILRYITSNLEKEGKDPNKDIIVQSLQRCLQPETDPGKMSEGEFQTIKSICVAHRATSNSFSKMEEDYKRQRQEAERQQQELQRLAREAEEYKNKLNQLNSYSTKYGLNTGGSSLSLPYSSPSSNTSSQQQQQQQSTPSSSIFNTSSSTTSSTTTSEVISPFMGGIETPFPIFGARAYGGLHERAKTDPAAKQVLDYMKYNFAQDVATDNKSKLTKVDLSKFSGRDFGRPIGDVALADEVNEQFPHLSYILSGKTIKGVTQSAFSN